MTDGAKAIVGLAEAVESLRAELMKAVEAGKDQPMQFSVEPVELTAQVAVTKEADGKIGWHLLGAGGSWEPASTQTLTLKLAPVWKKPDGTLERDFTIASAGPAGDVIEDEAGAEKQGPGRRPSSGSAVPHHILEKLARVADLPPGETGPGPSE